MPDDAPFRQEPPEKNLPSPATSAIRAIASSLKVSYELRWAWVDPLRGPLARPHRGVLRSAYCGAPQAAPVVSAIRPAWGDIPPPYLCSLHRRAHSRRPWPDGGVGLAPRRMQLGHLSRPKIRTSAPGFTPSPSSRNGQREIRWPYERAIRWWSTLTGDAEPGPPAARSRSQPSGTLPRHRWLGRRRRRRESGAARTGGVAPWSGDRAAGSEGVPQPVGDAARPCQS